MLKAQKEKQEGFNAYVTFEYIDQTDPDNPVKRNGYAPCLNGDMSSSFSDLFSGITGVNYMETDMVHLRSLSGLKTIPHYDEKTEDFLSADFEVLPSSISIYPKDFESKDVVTKHLDKWNDKGDLVFNLNGEEHVITEKDRENLTYQDTIQLIITVINALINAITIALVAFTSLSLVVSCFMIAVITYISVVERIKEIGVIRSLGGRKKDVANLFVMETLLTGLFSGLFGIGITYVLQVVFNLLLKGAYNITIANLTIPTAIIMICVSILLSVVSGLIPSQSAAHKDPVVALRTAD